MPRITLDGTNPTQLTALLTTTLMKSRAEIVDNVFSNNPLLTWLRMKGAVQYEDGGESIQIPLIYGENEAVEAYGGYDLLNVDPQEGLTAAVYNWKLYHVPVVISGEELMKNRGTSALARLLEAKRVQATKSLSGRLNYDLVNGHEATVSTPENKRLFGLKDFVNWAPNTQANYPGGILASTHTWWQNQYLNAADWSATPSAVESMVAIYNDCSDGADHPDLIIADKDSFENYERKATVDGKNFTNTMWADLGFTNLSFKGATIVFDQSVPDAAGDTTRDGFMFFLNSAYLSLVVHRQRDFTIREFGYPPNQDAYLTQIYWMGAFCCSNRSKQGLLFDTASWA